MITQDHQACPKFSGINGDIVQVRSLIELLRLRAAQQTNEQAYTFLVDGEKQALHFSYGELDRQARNIAAILQSMKLQGERAVLLYPQGLDYIAAFFGCLYAGVIAVPAYPPKNRRNLPRLQTILGDSQAALILSTKAIANASKILFPDIESGYIPNWLLTDELLFDNSNEWQPPKLNQDSLAFLQYTSGSTGNPKGVMVSHGNLMANQKIIKESFGHDSQSTVVGWLPLYHDMGLIGNILQPLYIGAPVILMSPMAFLEKPLRWLQAISDYRAHTSGGPNFAYDLCVQKISQQEKAQLDLSFWQLAFNGSEPVQPATLDRFAKAFACCGFRPEAFYPCYGLAEATLFVTGTAKPALPTVKSFNKSALEKGQATKVSQMDDYRRLVSSGIPGSEHRVRIVNPDTQELCAVGHIGEIQVTGPSIAQGYWQNASETAAAFVAELNDEKSAIWLRTGDLGFIDNDELFVSGRLKDLIIVRGRNYHPHDIESAAQAAVNCVNPGCLAAFAVDGDDGEKLVLLAELKRGYLNQAHYRAEFSAIRSRLVDECGVQADTILLLKPGAILKTTSGKIRRSACREAFESTLLAVVATDYLNQESPQKTRIHAQCEGEELVEVIGSKLQSTPEQSVLRQALLLASQNDGVHLLAQYLRDKVAALSGLAQEQIDLFIPVLNLGVDSLKAIELKYALDDLLNIDLSVVLLLEDKSITSIAEQALSLAKQQSGFYAQTTDWQQKREAQQTGEMPLSLGQQAIWTVCRVESDTVIYNLPIALWIHSAVDPEALRSALRVLLSRHEQLRVGFRLNEAMQPVQRVLPETEPSFKQVFCDQELERQQQISMAIRQPFDLDNGPLLRALLISHAEDDHILLFCAHHIVVDFRSLAILLDELKKIYAAHVSKQQGSLPLLTAHYVDYVNWQQTYLNSKQAEQAWQYWQQQLAGEIPKLVVPADRSRSRAPAHRGAIETLVIAPKETHQLRSLADQNGVTLYVVLLSLFKVLLYRYSGQQDIVVGSPVLGRPKSEFASLVGYFVNPVALRTRPTGNKTFIDFLTEVRQTVHGALKHQDYPFSLLVEKLQPERETGLWPFYQVMFVLQGAAVAAQDATVLALGVPGIVVDWPGLEAETTALPEHIVQFDLTLMIAGSAEGLLASFQYDTELFDRETILRMQGHFQCLLQGVLHDPLTRLAELPLLTVPERNQIVEWNATQFECPQDLCIHQLFEQQAAKTPDAVAVIFTDQSFTYAELNAKANQLAHYLLELGIHPDDRVAICVERGLDMVVGLLGILKSGGAYVPLDPGYPRERLAFMLKDSEPVALLTQVAHERSLLGLETKLQIVLLDTGNSMHSEPVIGFTAGLNFRRYSAHNPDTKVLGLSSRHLAYVIYTSGSTGQPKGVMIEHVNAVNFIAWAKANFPHERLLNTLFSTSINFDLAVFELFVPLSSGTTVHLVKDILASSDALKDVTLINTVPSAISALLEINKVPYSAQSINLAGEPLKKELVERIFVSTNVQAISNLYGPTESTTYSTWVTMCRVDGFLDHIGRPIANTQIYILDSHLQQVPLGVTGNIYIGGAGVARGYLNRPELTAERFLVNPFIQTDGSLHIDFYQPSGHTDMDTNARLYKTGDLGRWLPDGSIEYLGRNDFQVKIRGFRIELGEIEAQLVKCPGVRGAVVVAREDSPGDKRLVAYLLAEDKAELYAPELRSQLAAVLPGYQLPSAYVTLDAFPLTPNGKLDRKALPAPEYQGSQRQEFVAPRDEAEEAVARIWCEVLGTEQLSIHDNFFDLGGHSLSVVQVMGRIKESFGIAAPVKILFESPTIAEFVDKLAEVEAE